MDTPSQLVRDASDANDQYWYIHGKRYDLSAYVDKHPAGSLPLELTRGRECTELFESYHSLCKRPRKMLTRFEVKESAAARQRGGCPMRASPFEWDETPFYDDLKTRVSAHFRQQPNGGHKTPWASWALLVSFTLLTALSFVAWVLGHWYALLTLPLFYWLGASNLMHTGGHFALSRRPWVNRLGSLMGSVHIAPATWHRQHNIGHHAFTNLEGRDPDLNHFLQVGVPMPGFRLSPRQRWLPKYAWHRFAMATQSMMTTAGPSILNTPEYLVDGKMGKAVPYLFSSRWAVLGHILGRLAVVAVCFVLPFFLFTPWKAAAFAAVPVLVHGWLYFAFSQVSHVNADCVPDPDLKIEWAAHQVGTSHDYRTQSRFWSVFSIGLNNQIVHHLFPQVAPWHYPALAKIVAATCETHGVPYRTSPTWTAAFRKLLTHTAALNDPAPAGVAPVAAVEPAPLAE